MISYGRHSVAPGDIEAVVEVLRSDWLTTGPVIELFEAEIAGACGGIPAVAVSSGTSALHAAYFAVGLGPGDEVITPPLTFIATQAAAMHLGAKPVFADVHGDTGNLDPEWVISKITSRTKAIVAVDFAGHPADLRELRSIAEDHGIVLIEDAAHSLGSTYRDRPVGSWAHITTLSFYPTKNITTGEGGAVVSSSPDLLLRAKEFSRQGLVRESERFLLPSDGPWHQEVHSIGLNYRMTDIAAALGISQVQRLEEFKRRRAMIKTMYDQAFEAENLLTTPAQRPYVDPMWHLYPLRVVPELRLALFNHLRAAGVGVQVNYIPAYKHPALHGLGAATCQEAENYYASEISLPMHYELTDEQVGYISGLILEFLAQQ